MTEVNDELRRQMVAERAYFRAERRGFKGGNELADWLEAEQEIDAELHGGLGSLEARLAGANEHLKAFRKRIAKMSEKTRREAEDEVAKLMKYRDRLRKRIRQARNESGQAADRARAKAEETWSEIAALLERLGKRKTGETMRSRSGH